MLFRSRGREIAAALHVAQARRLEAGKRVCGIMTAENTRAEGEAEDVYLLTARHHHLAITKVRVWKRYLDVLKEGGREGEMDGVQGGEEGWDRLEVWRTGYWSLLKPEERVVAGRAVGRLLRELKAGVREEEVKEVKAEVKAEAKEEVKAEVKAEAKEEVKAE